MRYKILKKHLSLSAKILGEEEQLHILQYITILFIDR